MICHREEIRFVIQMSYFIEHSHLKLYVCETPEVSAGRELAFVAFVPLAKGCIRAALQIPSFVANSCVASTLSLPQRASKTKPWFLLSLDPTILTRRASVAHGPLAMMEASCLQLAYFA